MDGIEVLTKSTCKMCRKVEWREGAEGKFPPVGWAEFSLTYRLDGSGWTNNLSVYKTLCPECAYKVELFVGGE